jgi:UDP-N-acetylmuramoyl-tripeptide--D-alanyl-D-alanine ligase
MKAKIKNLVVNRLWREAGRVLKASEPTAVAVTGSVGKTTTREAIAHVLADCGRPIIQAKGNMNTEISVPLVICGLVDAPHRPWQWLSAYWRSRRFAAGPGLPPESILVLEFASEQEGDIAFLAERVPLDLAVFTLFSPSHLSMDTKVVQREKSSLIKGLKPSGVIVANADDAAQVDLLADRRAISYGYAKGATVRLAEVKTNAEGMTGTIVYRGVKYPFTTKLIGRHQAMSVAAAFAAGVKLGRTPSQLIARLATLAGQPGRLRLIEGRKQRTIIDDSYNSSPAAAAAALDVLTGLRRPGHRTVAIMGNMNSLGRGTVSAHLELGRQAARAKIDYLIAVGPNARRIVKGAREGGMAEQHLIEFETPERLMTRLDNLLQTGDLILVKGSQNGMLLERVVKLLMAHPERAKEELVRQY